MDSAACGGTFLSWDERMLAQLADGVCSRFPVMLTYNYACDRAVITSLGLIL